MNKNLKHYIEFGIKCMRDDLDWAVKMMKDKDISYRKSFVRSGIIEERNRMLGTLDYLLCYEKTITEDEYNKYCTMVNNEYYKLDDKVYEVLK